ncbi:gliding motility lipoprotein GldD [Draconibacterium sp. IB214405]|uniref:gliding motility lipoprotein GldD n=1 Tax=Draconibacterium sp. IB214405 TaxID=3097352 RepID=UPI002A1096E8|nr:gliding motility lipoprotein GldD [Draconibacterium sp. IB214405]MDX8341042.1 gliding motility lipoprotein GldD [Draconibacterium sp. IB214405]
MRNTLILLLLLFVFGCKENYTPKPRGYYRIDFPEKSYTALDHSFPYNFEIPEYAQIEKDNRNPDKPYWINVAVPANKVEIHISYYDIDSDQLLFELMEETRTLAYKHSVKADAIDERLFLNPQQKVYGTIYAIEGNAASPMQFFLTDSTRHFLRGAFYIREVPDIDSLSPVINFIEPDIIHLIETTSWNN